VCGVLSDYHRIVQSPTNPDVIIYSAEPGITEDPGYGIFEVDSAGRDIEHKPDTYTYLFNGSKGRKTRLRRFRYQVWEGEAPDPRLLARDMSIEGEWRTRKGHDEVRLAISKTDGKYRVAYKKVGFGDLEIERTAAFRKGVLSLSEFSNALLGDPFHWDTFYAVRVGADEYLAPAPVVPVLQKSLSADLTAITDDVPGSVLVYERAPRAPAKRGRSKWPEWRDVEIAQSDLLPKGDALELVQMYIETKDESVILWRSDSKGGGVKSKPVRIDACWVSLERRGRNLQRHTNLTLWVTEKKAISGYETHGPNSPWRGPGMKPTPLVRYTREAIEADMKLAIAFLSLGARPYNIRVVQ